MRLMSDFIDKLFHIYAILNLRKILTDMKKKLLAALLASALAAGMLPTSACAVSSAYTSSNATLISFTDSAVTADGAYSGYEIEGTDVSITAAGTYVFNERKMLDASHVVVFCAKTAMDDAWLERVVDQEEADGRFNTPEAKAANHKGRTYFADMHRVDLKDDDQWMAKQVYLNVGNFLLGVAALGLDAVPIEGFDAAILDEEFGLKEKGFTSLVVVPVGHHSVEDFNATLPKSRLPLSTIVTEC